MLCGDLAVLQAFEDLEVILVPSSCDETKTLFNLSLKSVPCVDEADTRVTADCRSERSLQSRRKEAISLSANSDSNAFRAHTCVHV